MVQNKPIWPGLLLAICLGVFSWLLSRVHISFDALVIGIVIGIIVRTIIGERAILIPGLSKSVAVFIPIGIILYGSNLRFNQLAEVPTEVWLQILISITIIFVIVVKLGNRLKLSRALSLLIGVGTAICGASAILLTAPVANAKSEDTAKSLLVITFLGIIGVFLWPLIGEMLNFSSDQYALFSATTLQQTGLVKTAVAFFDPEALPLAMVIKMARITIIIPLILLVSILGRFKSMEEAAQGGKSLDVKIPWFLWAFIIVGLLFSYIKPLSENIRYVSPMASFVWTIAMVSIGLSVDVRQIFKTILKPLVLGLIAWLAAVIVFFVSVF